MSIHDNGNTNPTLQERCSEMGVPVWRCDETGAILTEPAESGLIGLWLRSGFMSKLVASAVRAWRGQDDPDVAELYQGCWAVPLVESATRHRPIYTVGIVLSKDAMLVEPFDDACRSAQVDPRSARVALNRLATHTEHSAHRLKAMLEWMHEDLATRQEQHETIESFTRQLTDSYETVAVLFSLGRSMGDVTQPERFVRHVCEQLSATLSFKWIAARFVRDERLTQALSDQVVVSGDAPCSQQKLADATNRQLSAFEGRSDPFVICDMACDGIVDATVVLALPVTHAGDLAGILLAGDKQGNDPQVSSYDTQLLEAATGFMGAFLDNVCLYADQRAMFLGTLQSLTASIDAKDRYTFGHSERVAHLSAELARLAGESEEYVERIRIAGLVHDVGKIGVPEAVLCKPGRLTDAEFEAIKAHPEIGYTILKDIPLLEDVLPGVLYHHERWDGRGYPRGIAGEEIPLIARYIALADTFDAMSSTRSYRPAMPREKVRAEIRRCAGSQFDPGLAELFLTIDLVEYDELVSRHSAGRGESRAA